MAIYTLIFKIDRGAVRKIMEFEGETGMGSFPLIEADLGAHLVKLWTAGEKLAELQRGPLERQCQPQHIHWSRPATKKGSA